MLVKFLLNVRNWISESPWNNKYVVTENCHYPKLWSDKGCQREETSVLQGPIIGPYNSLTFWRLGVQILHNKISRPF